MASYLGNNLWANMSHISSYISLELKDVLMKHVMLFTAFGAVHRFGTVLFAEGESPELQVPTEKGSSQLRLLRKDRTKTKGLGRI